MRQSLSEIFGRFRGLKRMLLLSALSFIAIAVVANSVVIVQRQEALGRVSRYNLTWLMSEAAEFLAERPDLKRGVDELETALATIEKLVPGLPDPQVALRLRGQLDPL